MKIDFLNAGETMRLEAQCGADLEVISRICDRVCVKTKPTQVKVLESELSFKRDHDHQGDAWLRSEGTYVLAVIELQVGYLTYVVTPSIEYSMRCATASTIGHHLLNAFDAAGRHAQAGVVAGSK